MRRLLSLALFGNLPNDSQPPATTNFAVTARESIFIRWLSNEHIISENEVGLLAIEVIHSEAPAEPLRAATDCWEVVEDTKFLTRRMFI